METQLWVVAAIVGVNVGVFGGLLAMYMRGLVLWYRKRVAKTRRSLIRQELASILEHQRQLLESMRRAAAARAASEGVDFVLMPCVCRAPGAGFAIDCRRCDDTGFVEVVV